MKTSASANANVHRVKRVSANRLVLAPGNGLWVWATVFLLVGIFAVVICRQKQVGGGVMAAVVGAPLFAAAGFGFVGFIYARFGTRATFDNLNSEVVVTGARHGSERRLTIAEVQAVQLCDAGRKGEEGSWQAYQLNLVMRSGERINLLDSAGETELREMAKEIAGFLKVPLFEGSERL